MGKRYIGLDVHRLFLMVAAVAGDQTVIAAPRKVAAKDFASWMHGHLTAEDEVVVEASAGIWELYDQLSEVVGRVVVAHPYHVKLIASSFVKTDKRDALALARLLAANIVPEVWVPAQHVRQLRSLIYHRFCLVRSRATARNRVRATGHRFRIPLPEGRAGYDPALWEKVTIPPGERLRLRHDMAQIEFLSAQIKEVEEELGRQSLLRPWSEDLPFLIQLPGIGLITGLTILSAIGEIARFPTAKRLVSYAGLGTRLHQSGEAERSGGITKQGRAELRYTMVEVAWNAILHSPVWKAEHERLAARLGRQKAAVAIARKLLVTVWHVLTKHEIDRRGDPSAITRSIQVWGWKNRLAVSSGMSGEEFTQMQLGKLGIRLERVVYCSRASDPKRDLRAPAALPRSSRMSKSLELAE
jgi:transposase